MDVNLNQLLYNGLDEIVEETCNWIFKWICSFQFVVGAGE